MCVVRTCTVGILCTQHEPKSQKNGRISQHYKASLTDTFDHYQVSFNICVCVCGGGGGGGGGGGAIAFAVQRILELRIRHSNRGENEIY